MAEVGRAEIGAELSSSPPQKMAKESSAEAAAPSQLTAAQRARMERQRLRARELHHARLANHTRSEPVCRAEGGGAALDSGGGFLLEPAGAGAGAGAPVAPPAPLAHAALQPECLECGRRVPHSYLLDTFQFAVCDDCRDEEGAHALLTRTEAKSEFLLKDCDLDLRPPPLPCVRRRNPHRAAAADMRLYLRAQLHARALQVWGSDAGLAEERARRAAARARAAGTRADRKLRALRLQVRSSAFTAGAATAHRHSFGPERSLGGDAYCRECTLCQHQDVYEKM